MYERWEMRVVSTQYIRCEREPQNIFLNCMWPWDTVFSNPSRDTLNHELPSLSPVSIVRVVQRFSIRIILNSELNKVKTYKLVDSTAKPNVTQRFSIRIILNSEIMYQLLTWLTWKIRKVSLKWLKINFVTFLWCNWLYFNALSANGYKATAWN